MTVPVGTQLFVGSKSNPTGTDTMPDTTHATHPRPTKHGRQRGGSVCR